MQRTFPRSPEQEFPVAVGNETSPLTCKCGPRPPAGQDLRCKPDTAASALIHWDPIQPLLPGAVPTGMAVPQDLLRTSSEPTKEKTSVQSRESFSPFGRVENRIDGGRPRSILRRNSPALQEGAAPALLPFPGVCDWLQLRLPGVCVCGGCKRRLPWRSAPAGHCPGESRRALAPLRL